MGIALSVLMTLLAFVAIIFIHELGHFAVAKSVGIRVERFAIGMDLWGLRLFKWKRGETEYIIGLFPLGGYVKLAGQEDFGRAEVEHRSDEFGSKSVWQRIRVLAAGPVFNFISAYAFAVLALIFGFELTSSEIGQVVPGSAAWEAGLEEGDRIVAYNGFKVGTFGDLSTEVGLGGHSRPMGLKILRGGELLDKTVYPRADERGFASLGVEQALGLRVSILEGSPAQIAGLRDGDVVFSIEGKELRKWSEVVRIVRKLGDKGITVVQVQVLREGKLMDFKVGLEAAPGHLGHLGILLEGLCQIKAVRDGTAAQKLGLARGQRILALGGREIWQLEGFDWGDDESATLELKVAGDNGSTESRSILYPGSPARFLREVDFAFDYPGLRVQAVDEGSPAAQMGFLPGDEIIWIQVGEGAKLDNPSERAFSSAIYNSPEEPVKIGFRRDGSMLELAGNLGRGKPVFRMGISTSPKLYDYDLAYVLWWPVSMLRTAYKSLTQLVSGQISAKHISGPVGIVSITYKVSQTGVGNLFFLLAFISIHIAFLNLLPIPALDGGHIFLCLIEALRGKALGEEWIYRLQVVGMSLLLSLVLFATWNDLRSFFS
ncbi:MAG: RIP metalloprotease RseP [Planctomycetes bacterium]|nr:RIP metalloprotease RseP [Planctomycetota bacterium]